MQPGQQKITQFDEVTSTQSGDVIPIVRGGQNKKISVENFTGVLPEGWLTLAEAWTFASFGNGVGVITIPEGNINRYPNGTRVWFKQGTPTATNRYGVVIASTTTTLTVVMVGSTTLQNLAIQQPAVSSEVAPRTSENIDFTALLEADSRGWRLSLREMAYYYKQSSVPSTSLNANGTSGDQSQYGSTILPPMGYSNFNNFFVDVVASAPTLGQVSTTIRSDSSNTNRIVWVRNVYTSSGSTGSGGTIMARAKLES